MAEVETNKESKKGWLSAILYISKVVLGYWGLLLSIGVASIVLSLTYEKFGIIIILIPIFIAFLSYHHWLKQELRELKDEVEHLRNVDTWSKKERQYFLGRLKE